MLHSDGNMFDMEIRERERGDRWKERGIEREDKRGREGWKGGGRGGRGVG